MYGQDEQCPVIKMVRTMLASPLFLTGAIGYSVYGLFELLGGLAGSAAESRVMSVIDNLGGAQSGYGMGGGHLQGYVSVFNGVNVLGTLLGSVPAILIAVGMWMLYATAKSSSRKEVNLTGISMIRVVVIIQLVFTCIGAALIEIACLVILVGAGSLMSYLGADYGAGGIMVIAMLFVAVFAAAEIIFYLKLMNVIKTMKNTVVSGRPDCRISKYAEIFCYILGGFSVFSALMSLVGMSIYGFLGSAGSATSYIAFAIYLMRYRRNMEQVMRNPAADMPMQALVQPQYQTPVQPQYQAPAQPQYQAPAQSQQQPPQQLPQNGETAVLQYYNETSVLSGQFMSGGQMQLVRMTRQKTNETFCISKQSFWIGKDAANVDYCISDNSAISRRHALFTIQNGRCCVRDNHSTNRVFLNGQAIQPDVDTPISDGDRVRLGDEEFIVNIG